MTSRTALNAMIAAHKRSFAELPSRTQTMVLLAQDTFDELPLQLGVALVLQAIQAELQRVVLGQERVATDERIAKRPEEPVGLRASDHELDPNRRVSSIGVGKAR